MIVPPLQFSTNRDKRPFLRCNKNGQLLFLIALSSETARKRVARQGQRLTEFALRQALHNRTLAKFPPLLQDFFCESLEYRRYGVKN
jgi:thymidylate kinase